MTETIHSLADLALQHLTTDGAAYTLSTAAQQALTAQLAATPAADLDAAVRALVSLAHFLARRHGPQAARALLEVASTAIKRLREASTPRTLDRLQDRARHFARFHAHDSGPRAPSAVYTTSRAPSPFRRVPARV
jgi:hypothetical protein